MTEKPLHVQVAQALGWTCIEYAPPNLWTGCRPSSRPHSPCPSSNVLSGEVVPTYDTDWSATGPLIEKYELALGQTGMEDPKPTWVAWWPGSCDVDTCSVDAPAHTPLLAACHLLLSLKT